MASSRRGLVAPQNTFLDAVARKAANQNCSFIVANARIVDYPIVHASETFVQLLGFASNDLLQRSCVCSMMHGESTNIASVERLKTALQTQVEDEVEIVLYKKNKTPLWLLVHTSPIRSHNDIIVMYLLLFRDITALKQPILEQNGKASSLSKFAWLARNVVRNKSTLGQSPSAAASTELAADTAATPVRNHFPMTSSNQVHPSDPAAVETISSINMSQLLTIDQTEVVPYYRQEAPKTPPHIILHYSMFKARWNWLILALTFYTAVVVPYNAAFESKTLERRSLIIIDSIVDVIFLTDIFINFHSTFVGHAGEIVSNAKVIRRNYLKTWFVIDLLSCLPYDFMNYAFEPPVSSQESINSKFSAIKVIRLLRLTRVVRKLHMYIEYGGAALLLLLIMFVLVSHWFACIWYTIGVTEAYNNVTYGWLQTLGRDINQQFVSTNSSTGQMELQGGPTSVMAYVTALYFTLSCMTSVGFGNVSASTQSEKIFSIFMMIFGALLYATIFGNVTTIFQQMYSSTGRYHELLSSIKEFMKTHQVPVSLSERVIDYVASSWAFTKGIDDSKVLNHCPKDMKGDLCFHLNRTVFSENPAFRLASNGCLRELALHFTRIHCAPGETVFHQGESIDALFFIVSGSIEIVQDDEVVAILAKGDVFGDKYSKDIAVGQSAANVRALTYCDLHCIKRDDLLHVLELYQPFAHSFARNLTLSYNLRQRLVFRKLADVQREKELANRSKDDSPLDASTDLTVRRLISRFRRVGVGDRRTSTASLRPSSVMLNNNDPFMTTDDTLPVTEIRLPTTPIVPVTSNANGSIENGGSSCVLPAHPPITAATSAMASSKLGRLGLLLRNASAAAAASTTTTQPPPPPSTSVALSIGSPSPSSTSSKNGFTWPSTQSSSGADRQGHLQTDAVDGVTTVHQREQPQQKQPEITSVNLNEHHRSSRSRCHCCGSGDGSESNNTQVDIDRLNERIDRIDLNIAAILRLLTSSNTVERSSHDSGGASSEAAEKRQTHETGRAAVTSGGEIKRSSSQSPSNQRMTMSPLFMDTINETDEDSGVQQSSGSKRPSNASGADGGRELGDDVSGRCGSNASNDSKRMQIQHDLEIL